MGIESTTFIIYIKVMSPTPDQPLLRLEAVSLTHAKRTILEAVSLAIHAGEIVSVIGPNGAGKTCLVKVMLGLLPASQGQVIRKANLTIGYMPQKMPLTATFPLTVERFLKLGLKHDDDITTALAQAGVTHVLNTPLFALSGGELQRVLLARVILRKPQLLVLDEPAQGVDLRGQAELYDLICHIRDELKCGVLLVSHDLNVVMAQTDIVFCLNQHVCCSGTPERVSRDPAFTALFGLEASKLAFYTHRHDHHHNLQGSVVDCEKDGCHD